MGKQGKIWTMGILGFVLIIVLGVMAAGNKRNREDTSGTDGLETSVSVSVEEYMKEQDTIMADMMKDMEDVPKSGSAAIHFLSGMIPHHQSAIFMSESYLKYSGKSEELKTLAGNVIKLQQDEIEQMKAMIERLEKAGDRDEEAEAAYLEEYGRMMAAHTEHMGHSTAGNVDWAFAEGMTLHHQMAVDMSEAVLNHSKDDEVRKLARDIIDLQKAEIKQMDEILKKMAAAQPAS